MLVEWADSPNFGPRPSDSPIDTIVLHHTASSGIEGVIKWFGMEESRVSAHFTVGKDGRIVQHVSTFDRAWHAGVSRDHFGRRGVNDFSVGIEIVHTGERGVAYPPEQVEAVAAICSVIIRRHKIRQITSHEYIALPPGRKPDPIDYPWESLRRFQLPLYY